MQVTHGRMAIIRSSGFGLVGGHRAAQIAHKLLVDDHDPAKP